MGATVRFASEAALGESLTTLLQASDAWKLWAPQYDAMANPLLSLEMRLLRSRLGPLRGKRVLDIATGTGRWMKEAAAQGARVYGLDISAEMLAFAPPGCVIGDMVRLPFGDDAADLAICSFALAYTPSPEPVIQELRRVARAVIVSDVHPGTEWSRGFGSYRIPHYVHGELHPDWQIPAAFGEPERRIFEELGKEDLFTEIPAILMQGWVR